MLKDYLLTVFSDFDRRSVFPYQHRYVMEARLAGICSGNNQRRLAFIVGTSTMIAAALPSSLSSFFLVAVGSMQLMR